MTVASLIDPEETTAFVDVSERVFFTPALVAAAGGRLGGAWKRGNKLFVPGATQQELDVAWAAHNGVAETDTALAQQELARSDKEFTRGIDDLADALIAKGVLVEDELPAGFKQKRAKRKTLRGRL